ncbi:hypothetical protein HNO52_17445 [Billgrantia diversa]|uniref:hypothetical protein n=1 Tax=Halomonas sp. MCCC 1A13316 TaxID=2733487 RepID=UPI0018A5917E|nr:hypothetical protein [Halomonas sp. MCCC 1A13316]QOR40103.1 hypothetical protein HNO52_17445 [Halomonas sp. MCCC 1A13316]
MNTVELTIYSTDAKDLARILRIIARRIYVNCEEHGSACLPTRGSARLIHINGQLVAELQVRRQPSLEDIANLASAERMGNIKTMAGASDALSAILSLLRQERSPLERYGLLIGAEIVTAWLSERADFLRIMQEEDAE